MKKKMKKAVSLIGTLAMAASLAVPASYAETAAVVTDGTTLEMEDFLADNPNSGFGRITNDGGEGSASNGAAAGGYIWLGESSEYSVTFTTDLAGSYDLELGVADRGAGDWLSPVKMTVNGTDYGYFRNSAGTETDFSKKTSNYFKKENHTFNSYTTKTPVILAEGENTITFTAYSAKDNSWNGSVINAGFTHVCAAYDYITFSKVKLPEVANGTTLEMEDFISDNNGYSPVEHEKLHQSKAAVIGPRSDLEQSEYQVTFDVTDAGDYYLEIGLSDYAAGGHISAVKMTVNGEDYGYFHNTDNSESTVFAKKESYVSGLGNYAFRSCVTMIPVTLTEGENTIVFTAYNAKINTINYGAHVLAGYDYITFTKDAPRKITDGTTVELEEFLKKNSGFETAEADALSDKTAAKFGAQTSDESVTYSFAVDADVAGDYYISAGVAERGAGDWLSPVKLTVNGTDVGYFMTAGYTEDGFSCTQLNYAEVDVYKFHRYASKAPVALRQGENQITYTIYNASQNSYNGTLIGTTNQIYAALDYMTFNKVKTLSGVTMTVSDTLAVDGVSEIVLKDGDGSVIKPSDVAQITYSSSLETVATVTAEGKVTGVKPGRTRIDAEIRVNPGDTETIVVSAWVTVVEDEVFVANVQIAEGGKINFDVVNNTEFDDYENIKAIAASYLDGKMKSVASFSIGELLCGTNVSCEMTLNGYEDGDDVMIYVWNGLDTMVPVMTEKKAY